MDAVDSKLIHRLMARGRITWAELAHQVGLSAPAVTDRVRRLEERGVIRGYGALVAPDEVGLHLTALVAVTLEHPRHRAEFLALVQALPQIQECHHVAGDDDYVLKVRCRSTRQLDELISGQLKSLAGVARTRTTIVMSTLKETPVLPAPEGDLP